jgi:hypothetical protein
MKTKEDIESYLIKMEKPYEEIEEGMWILHDEEAKVKNIIIRLLEPILVFKIKVMEIPKQEIREELFKTLLEFNASQMIYGAYGVEQGSIVITTTLNLETLDFETFQTAIDELTLTINDHYPQLIRFSQI